MGFKKKNHTVPEIGITLPEAYAAIKNIYIEGERGNAEFVVQANRDNVFSLEPIERVYVPFTVNRNENPYKTAYNAAKGTKTVSVRGKEYVEHMPFYGWEDDVQTV